MNITSGIIVRAQKVVLYGPEGIGKSTFASKFPDPLFIDTEGSTAQLDVKRMDTPTSYAMLLQQIKYVAQNPDICKTLVIDTADWAERLCKQSILSKNNWDSIESPGYGKGYTVLAEEWGKLLELLNGVIQAGVNVLLTAHAMMRKFEQPDEMGAYDRWELKLEKKTAPMTKEWADMILFANYKTNIIVDQNTKSKKAMGGKRIIYTTHHPAWDAKNRHSLPEELPLDFSAIAHVFSHMEKMPEKQKTVSNGQEQKDQLPEPQAKKEDELAGIPKGLADLMRLNKVTEQEIQEAVHKKGYFPADMRIKDYPPGFVTDSLIGAWEQVFNEILAGRNKSGLPFDI